MHAAIIGSIIGSMLLAVGVGCFSKPRFDEYQDAARPNDLDNDGVGIALDNCPHVANDQHDADKDRIGDACDPNASTYGDRAVSIDLFDGATNAWQATPAAWVQDIGAWTSPPAGTSGVLLFYSTVILDEPTLEIGFTLLDLGQPSSGNNVAVTLDASSSAATCRLEDLNHVDNDSAVRCAWMAARTSDTSITPRLMPESTYALRIGRGANLRWSVQGASFVEADDVPYATAYRPRIAVNSMQIRVSYIALYDRIE